MAGQDLIAKVVVDKSAATTSLENFIKTYNNKEINLKVTANTAAAKSTISQLKEVEKTAKSAQKAANGTSSKNKNSNTGKTIKNETNAYDNALKSIAKLEKAYQKLGDKRAKLQSALSTGSSKGLLDSVDISNYQKQLQVIESKMKQIEVSKKALSQVSGMNGKDVKETLSYANSLNLESNSIAASADGLIKQNQEAVKSYVQIQREAEKAQNTIIGFDKIGNRLNEYYNKYGAQIQKNISLYNQFMTLMNKAQNGGFASVQEANRAFAAFRMNCRQAGVEVESIGYKLERTFGARVRSALAGQGVYMIQSALRDIVQNAIDVDTALTELKKVTDATDAEYAQFMDNASTRAQSLGATLKDVVSATADYARLGYDIPDATQLADSAILYLNVGDDVESMDQATKSLISTMQGLVIDLVKRGELLENPESFIGYNVIRNDRRECIKTYKDWIISSQVPA